MRSSKIENTTPVTTSMLLLLPILFPILFPIKAVALTTVEISTYTTAASSSCLRYQVKGVCFWLVCIGKICTVRTSPRISHYLPDVVVSAYEHQGKNPWVEMAMLGRSPLTKGGSVATPLEQHRLNPDISSSRPNTGETLYFKAVDIVGNPLVSTSRFTQAFTCSSKAISFMPYFISHLDWLGWAMGIPETFYPQALIPGLREIGMFPLNTWGSVYPRNGFVMHVDEPKTAAVAAQRAGDIVTRPFQPHVYIPLVGCKGQGCQAPPPLRENDASSGDWQMLAPMPSITCGVFGSNDSLHPLGWSGGKVSDTRQYAWNLWRPYACCIPRLGIYLGHTP